MISLLSRIIAALLCILCICSFTSNAQNNNYNFSRVDIENGLSNNQVYSIYRDSTGFVWIGTASGLNRFDGYNCKVFSHNLNDSNSIPDNIVSDIFGLPDNKMWIVSNAGISVYDAATEIFDKQYQRHLKYLNLPQARILYSIKDKNGNYWFLFENNILYQYVGAERRAIRVTDVDKNLTGKIIDHITEDFGGNIWLVYSNGYVALLNPNTMSPVLQSTDLAAMLPSEKLRLTIFADRLQNLWIYSRDEPLGLYNINTSTKVVRHLSKSSGAVKLNDNMIRGVVQDDKGIIWVATDHGGINLIDEKDNSISYLVNQENNRASLGYNSIEKIYNDNQGLIWVGTGKKGVSYFNQNIVQFGLYRHETDNKNSLPYSDINAFQEDRKGNVWIGTNGGGLIYFDRAKQTFKQYVNNPGDPGSLAGNIIVSLCLDHEDKLWVGTFLGGLDVFDGKSFTHYRHNPSDPGSVGDNSVWDIHEDYSNTIWIGTLKSGLDRFDRQTKKFIHYTNGTTPLSTHCNYIPDIFEDKDGNLWLSTSEGIEVLNKERTKFSFYNHSNDPKSLSYQNVTNITQDKRGLIWVATRMGLNVFNSRTQQFKRFTTSEGLPENIILAITEDLKGNLWITTPKGLCQLIIKTEKEDVFVEVRNFTETNNIQGKVFNESALATTLDGFVFVGGSTGFNIIDPAKIVSGKSIPPLVFTGIDIFNNEVNASQSVSDNVVLRKALPFSNEILLNHNENIFSIEFASLDFSHNNQYAYKLEGFNNSWMYTNSNNRKVTYTNIDPGTYCFKVRTTNSDGIWSNEEKTLNIVIKPPFWKTPMAFFVYILVLVAILYLARRYTLEKERMRFEVALQTKERERIQALDAVKTKFFTNVSHEFRTPLSLILAPLDRIIHGSTDPEQKKQVQLVQRNAKRLLALVNQLLDFRKMEVQEFKLQPTQGDIIKFIKEISSSFSDLSEMKNIGLTFSSNIDYFLTYFDKDKLEKILFNLLSNAFKYTHGGGQIEVHVEHTELNDSGDAQVIIAVTDSGIGIPADKQEMIFERFFQNSVSANLTNPGTGIGLAITKEFVKLHNGTVTVSSEPNKGTSFVVTLPLKTLTNSAVHAEAVNELITPVHEENGVEHKVNGQQIKRTRPVILLAEDDDDFRFYLKDNLKHVYDVIETINGQEAWEKLEKIQPDLIISDVMMPQMDGIELANRVRKNPLLASVPVVLLTAVGDEEMQLESYRLGVSDYIIKPFTYEILASRIKNLLDQAKLPSKKSHKLVDVTPSNIEIPPADEQFLKQVLQVIEKNISNPEFTVEELSKELFMHRVGMYRKLLSITGISPLEFIRNIRLKRGRQLLESSQMTIAEVAYEVGFNNPKKFSQHFKEEFGVTPSQFQKQHTNGV